MNFMSHPFTETCKTCNGKAFVYTPERLTTVVYELSSICEDTGEISYEETEKKERIGGVDICPACQTSSEANYRLSYGGRR